MNKNKINMLGRIFFAIILCNILIIHSENSLTFEKVKRKIYKSDNMKIMAVAGGDSESMIKCCREAKDLKIVNSILVGDAEKIKATAAKIKVDISDFEIVDIKDPAEIARYCSKLVHDKKADIYAKGSLETKYTFQAILDKEIGLRTENAISGVTIVELPKYKRLMILTDPHVRPYPTLSEKISSINNSVDLARAIGIVYPKVAILTAVKDPNPKMPETYEAKELADMNARGEIKNCVIDGPLPFEMTIDPDCPFYKGQQKRKIRGDADIVVFPNIHSANIGYHLMTHVLMFKSATLLTGTSAPCIINSRSGTAESKLNSIIISIGYSQYLKKKNLK